MNEQKNKPESQQAHNTTGVAIPAGNIEQIRDILFGSKMEDYERKFARLEERILKEISHLEDDTCKRFDMLESFIRQEIEFLNDKIKIETTNRDDSLKELATELVNTTKTIEKKLSDLEGSTDKDIGELRQTVLEQLKELLNETSNKHVEDVRILNRSVNEPRVESINLSTISGLLQKWLRTLPIAITQLMSITKINS